MKIQQVFAIYFSPTHGTKSYVEEIARGLSADFQTIDLTKPKERLKEYTFSDKDLVIFGAPVYAGRLPNVEGGIFQRLHGSQTPAIFNVSYGNREYEDALLEEKELCEENGFVGIAAAAWIAPHTFSDKIASGRPDEMDKKQIELFVGKVKELLEKKQTAEPTLTVCGNHPYKERKPMPLYPEASEICTNCNICALVCPTGAIDPQHPQKSDVEKCIACLACVKACPGHARGMFNPMFQGIVQKLEGALLSHRKEPEFFF